MKILIQQWSLLLTAETIGFFWHIILHSSGSWTMGFQTEIIRQRSRDLLHMTEGKATEERDSFSMKLFFQENEYEYWFNRAVEIDTQKWENKWRVNIYYLEWPCFSCPLWNPEGCWFQSAVYLPSCPIWLGSILDLTWKHDEVYTCIVHMSNICLFSWTHIVTNLQRSGRRGSECPE